MEAKTSTRLQVQLPKAAKRFEALLRRFTDLLQKKYQGQFDYLPFVKESSDWSLILSLSFQQQPLHLNDQDFFPIFTDGELMGALRRAGEKLSAEQLKEVMSLSHLILGETLSLLKKEAELVRHEVHMNSDNHLNGVVYISQFKKDRTLTLVPPISIRERKFVSIPTLIEAKTSEEAFRFALDLHQDSGRFAFINYLDLDSSVRQNLHELTPLGEMTVYLPNPQDLEIREQERLKRYLFETTPQNSAEPAILWLSSITLPYAILLRSRSIDQQLLKHLSISYFRLRETLKNVLGPNRLPDLH